MITTKELEVLDYLYKEDGRSSLKDLAVSFGVSERSIRYYMETIINLLPDAQIQLKKGIYEIGNIEFARKFLSSNVPSYYNNDIKKKYILYTVALFESINLTKISDILRISRSSAKLYLEDARSFLAAYHLTLTAHSEKGLLLQGKEENLRKLQLQILLEYNQQSDTAQGILAALIQTFQAGIEQPMLDLFIDIMQQELDSILSDYSHLIIKCYLIIMILRNKANQAIENCDNEDFLSNCSEYAVIKQHAALLDMHFQFSLNHYELLNLTDLFIGSHYSTNSSSKANHWFDHNLLVSKIITLFSKYYNVNLNQDNLLFHSLITHLKPTMYRLLHNIKLSDIHYDDIYAQFPKEYDITKKVLNELNFFTNVNADKDEIALLTLHFKAAINRYYSINPIRMNVLVVCSHGYGTSKLLEQQLLDTYEITIQDCIPYHYLNHYKQMEKIDLIITTIRSFTNYCNIPVLKVNPILQDQDIALLDQYCLIKRNKRIYLSRLLQEIRKSCTIHEEQQLIHHLQAYFGDDLIHDLETDKRSLLHFLPLENIKIGLEVASWREAIRHAGQLLVTNRYVAQSYADDMQTSFENYGSYMVIEDGIAIPHAKNEGNVYKTGLTLLILKHPVAMEDGKSLSVFFSFCSHDNSEHLDALVAISNLIKESSFKERLFTFQSESEVLQFIFDFVMKR